MEKQVIIINGHPGSGKTTVANIIAEKEGAMIRSSIDFVKEIAKDYFDWDTSKTEESRKFLSNMKTFLNDHTDLIEHDLEIAYERFQSSDDKFLIIDIREKDEIEKYKELFDAVTLFVENPKVEKISSNPSDEGVERITYDYTIYNGYCLKSLETEVELFLRGLEFDKFKAELYLRDADGDTFINYVSSLKKVSTLMNKWFIEQEKTDIYYVRRWLNEENEIIFDFGSYDTFFVIKNQKGLFL